VKTTFFQCFSLLALLALSAKGAGGERFPFTLRDVAGRSVSLADGHVSIVAVVNRANQHDARVTGDRVPRRFYGDERLRMIVIGTLQNKFPHFLDRFILALFRRRGELEAARIQSIYDARGVKRDAGQDVHLVADFDGSEAARFGVTPEDARVHIYLLGRDGHVLQHWTKVPESETLSDALDAVLLPQ
jgi:hypothetical protein